MAASKHLADTDHQHVWHPFTPMAQWREHSPLIIERAIGPYLIDTQGNRYIDGVSSLWCNVHGHRVQQIDQAIRDQLDKVAHTTLLGLASPPSIRLASRLIGLAPGQLNKVFYSDAGATAVEIALKMAVGYWHHRGQTQKRRFVAIGGAYHGDTTGSMSVGYCELFHRPFGSMLFSDVHFSEAPDACHPPTTFDRTTDLAVARGTTDRRKPLWPSEQPGLNQALKEYCLHQLDQFLQRHASETAAIVIEPVMQGAAGMICQPPGFLAGVGALATKYQVLLIADEVATGFGRTGQMFACQHESVEPDIMCVAKGLTGGYLPLAATLTTDEIEQTFCGPLSDRRTFYHGHTYTGNALACAAALASLELFDADNLIAHIQQSASVLADRLDVLRDPQRYPHVVDIRQRGLMVGIELGKNRHTPRPLGFSGQTGAALCMSMRAKGLIVRPLGDVVILMPIPAMPQEILHQMLDIVIESIGSWSDWD